MVIIDPYSFYRNGLTLWLHPS